jgi:DeoR family transcriptional regulator, fructose operon transcriptional repressor
MRVAAARRQRILELLSAGSQEAEELGAVLDVSLSTIRRDLSQLSLEGRLLRTYGGAVPVAAALPEQSVQQRALEHQAEKRAIARHAAELIQSGETVILDAGTTTGALATRLAGRRGLRVITNGLTAIQALSGATGVELIALGGTLRHISLGFVGPHAESVLRRITAAKVFLGADGVVAGRGICEATDEQASLKALMIHQAQEVFVLATADKLGRATSQAWTPLDRPWSLITDTGATDAQLEPFQQLGAVTIQCCDPSIRGLHGARPPGD